MPNDAPHNEKRAARVAYVLQHAQPSAKNALYRAFSGSGSPRQAIKAMCLVCVGYDRQEVKNCSSYACPLWAYRPFQADQEETAKKL